MGAKARMRATRAAPVAMVFANSAMAKFPPARRSPVMPEPTTAATRNAVPRASETTLLSSEYGLGSGRDTRHQFLVYAACDLVSHTPERSQFLVMRTRRFGGIFK